jgi:hypothetical protein
LASSTHSGYGVTGFFCNFDKRDIKFIIDTTFGIFGNHPLDIDVEDAREESISFSSNVKLVNNLRDSINSFLISLFISF